MPRSELTSWGIEITDDHIDALMAAVKPWLYERPRRAYDAGDEPLGREPTDAENKRYYAYAKEVLAGRAKELTEAKARDALGLPSSGIPFKLIKAVPNLGRTDGDADVCSSTTTRARKQPTHAREGK